MWILVYFYRDSWRVSSAAYFRCEQDLRNSVIERQKNKEFVVTLVVDTSKSLDLINLGIAIERHGLTTSVLSDIEKYFKGEFDEEDFS